MAKDYNSIDKIPTIIFGVLLIAFFSDLILIVLEDNSFRFFTKTLLMPLLLLWYYKVTTKEVIAKQNLLILGLVFSFFGDLFLLFSWGFIPGLGSFLLAHIFYILCLNKFKKKTAIVFLPLILIYLLGLIYLLFPHLGDMLIPVIFYGITISTMLYFSLKTGRKLLIFGALLFVISDSVLAYNLFVESDKVFNLIVMITYVFAQILLVKGFIKASQSIKT